MPRDAPTLPRQNTVEFLGKLMRGNSFEGGQQGEQDVDDGRVGALTRVRGGSTSTLAGGGESEPGSPLGGNRPGLRRRMSSSSGFPVDPYPLIEVGAFQQSDVSRRDPYGTAATEAEGEGNAVKTAEPRGVETSGTRAPTRRSARQGGSGGAGGGSRADETETTQSDGGGGGGDGGARLGFIRGDRV